MVLIQTPVKMQTHKPMQTPMLQRKQNPCFKDRLDYAQAALICCTAWSTLEDLIGPHAEDLSQISDETWWLACTHKLHTNQITARGRTRLECAPEWCDSPIEDQDDMLGAHGPQHERFDLERGDLANEPASVDWAMFAQLCEEQRASSSRDTKALQALEGNILPMKVMPEELKLPSQQRLDAFVASTFLSETEARKRPFALVVPSPSMTVANPQPLPPSESIPTDISTLVSDMAAAARTAPVASAAQPGMAAEEIRLPARPDLDTVARAFALNLRQCEAVGTIASTFLLRLLQKYPHDAALRARATEALLRFATQDYAICRPSWARRGRQVASSVRGACLRSRLGLEGGHHHLGDEPPGSDSLGRLDRPQAAGHWHQLRARRPKPCGARRHQSSLGVRCSCLSLANAPCSEPLTWTSLRSVCEQ